MNDRLARLERMLGREGRIALLRIRRGDWEARVLYPARRLIGDVGRGSTATAALDELLRAIDS